MRSCWRQAKVHGREPFTCHSPAERELGKLCISSGYSFPMVVFLKREKQNKTITESIKCRLHTQCTTGSIRVGRFLLPLVGLLDKPRDGPGWVRGKAE